MTDWDAIATGATKAAPPGQTDWDAVAAGGKKPQKPSSVANDALEVARQVGAGAVVDLPEMAGRAIQAFTPEQSAPSRFGARLVQDAAARKAEWTPDLEGRGPIAETLIKGARAVAPSVATLPAYAAGPAVGGLATTALFGGSQYTEEKQRMLEAGKSEEDARNAGLLTGAIQGGGEALANRLTLGMFGLGRKAAAEGMKGLLGQAVDTSVVKPFAKSVGTAMVGEPATEIAQDVSTAAVERGYGLPTADYADIAKESGQAALGMTALLAPFGLAGHYRNAKRAEAIDRTLSDPAAPAENRVAVVDALHAEAQRLGIPDADAWRTGAMEDVAAGRAIRRDTAPLAAPQDVPTAPSTAPQDVPTVPQDQSFESFLQREQQDIQQRRSLLEGGSSAVQEQGSDAGVLRSEQPEMGLPQVAQGNPEGQAQGLGNQGAGQEALAQLLGRQATEKRTVSPPAGGTRLETVHAGIRKDMEDTLGAILKTARGAQTPDTARRAQSLAARYNAAVDKYAKVFGQEAATRFEAQVRGAFLNKDTDVQRLRAASQLQAKDVAAFEMAVTRAQEKATSTGKPSGLSNAKVALVESLGQPGEISQGDAGFLTNLGKMIGTRVVFFRADPGAHEGFKAAGNDGAVFINASAKSTGFVQILGHEFMHTLRTKNPDAYKIIREAVSARLTPEQLERYQTEEYKVDSPDIMEELMADIMGNQFADPKFWGDVFNRVQKLEGPKAKSVLEKLITQLNLFIAKLKSAVMRSGQDFDVTPYINQLDTIKAAYTEAMAQHLAKKETSHGRMQGQGQEAAQEVDQPTPRRKDFTDPEQRIEVSTTVPTVKGMESAAYTENLVIDIGDILASREYADKLAKAVSTYNTVLVEQGAPTNAVIQALHDTVVENLLWLHDRMPEAIRNRAKLWYDGANKIASDWSTQFNINLPRAAATLAIFSPQKDWFQNVSLAERAIRILRERGGERWTPAMTAWFESWVGASADMETKHSRERHLAHARGLAGKRLVDLNDYDAAVFIRAFDETYHPREYRLVTPEGGFGDFVSGATADAQVGWPGFDTIEKVVQVLRDGRVRVINAALGGEHKVRNFYNNIVSPNSADGHVTIDTHAIGAGLFKAMSGESLEVKHNFGGTAPGFPGAGKSGATGASGTYAVFADAYREAARRRNLLPREMQSITWEAVRALFPAELKKGVTKKIETVWDQYKAGKITREEARLKVYELAGGLRGMSWEGTPVGMYPSAGGVSFDNALDADPTKRKVRKLAPAHTKDKVSIGLSAYTPSIKAFASLRARAQKGDRMAAVALQDVAMGGLKQLMQGLHVKITPRRATGLYGGKAEPSLALDVSFRDEERGQVLAALNKFAETFNQEQVHVRHAAKGKPGHVYPDGSYNTPVYTWALNKPLTAKQVQAIIESSNLYGLTFGDDFVEAYYVGDTNDIEALERFRAGANEAGRLLALADGGDGAKARRGTGRLWAYGRGDGGIGWPGVHGDVSAEPGIRAEAVQRAKSYLAGQSDAASPERSGESAHGGVRPSYGESREGSVQVVGVHYSPKTLTDVNSAFYGRGIPGEERSRVMASSDPRLRFRSYFYVNSGQGVTPEYGVGNKPHTVQLNNLYDLNADPKGLVKSDPNRTERAILDAGYDGYVANFGNQRAAVLIGKHRIPVRQEPIGYRGADLPAAELPAAPLRARLYAVLKTPWVSRTPAEWALFTKEKAPDLFDEIGGRDAFAGEGRLWPDQAVAAVRHMDRTSPPGFDNLPPREPGETDKLYAKRVIDKIGDVGVLEDKPDLYFNTEKADAIVPLSSLVSSKTEEENKKGGANAPARMAAAARGILSKRDPITVRQTALGRYEITDGNGTYTASKALGFKALPVVIERQQADNLDDIYTEATKYQADFGKAIKEIAQTLGVDALVPPDLKGRERAERKIKVDYNGDATQIKDILRASLVNDSLAQAEAAIEALMHVFPVHSSKNSFGRDTPDGYRDGKVVIWAGNVKAEIQIHLRGIIDVKERMHDLYVQREELIRQVHEANRDWLPEEVAKYEALNAAMKVEYQPAFERASKSKNSPLLTGTPLRNALDKSKERWSGSNAAQKAPPSGLRTNATGMSSTSKNSVSGGNSGSAAIATSKKSEPVKYSPQRGEQTRRLVDDLPAQEAWLAERAREAGASSVDDLLARHPEQFFQLAEQWRQEHPAAVMMSPRRGFFSPLARAVEGARQDVMPGAQWKLWIASNKSKLGLKDDELQWSGVLDYLDLRGKDKVTKAEIADYLNGNGVKVGDVVKGGAETAETITSDQAVFRLENNQPVTWYKESTDQLIEVYDPVSITADDSFYRQEVDAGRAVWMTGGTDVAGKARGDTKFAGYWEDSYKGGIPGTYREILVTLPNTESYEVYGNDGVTIKAFKTQDEARSFSSAQPYGTAGVRRVNKDTAAFRSRHWGEPNVLVHLRVDEVNGADGKRYLRVGEIQSDWGQQGKKEGFDQKDAPDWIAITDEGQEVGFDTEAEAEDWLDEYGGGGYVEQRSRVAGVPQAPFVTDTKAWVALGVKRAILHALDVGADGIVFGTGQQNADLYDLSRHIDAVNWAPEAGKLRAYKDGHVVVARDDVRREDLPNIIGKEAAEKIAAAPAVDDGMGDGPVHRLKGLDLKVGGEGMKAFYDQIVPQVANDVLKKLGGGKVATVRVPTPEGGWQVRLVDGSVASWPDGVPKIYNNQREAKNSAPALDNRGAKVERVAAEGPGFLIPDTMRGKVEAEGMPLFSPQRGASGLMRNDHLAFEPGSGRQFEFQLRKVLDLYREEEALRRATKRMLDQPLPASVSPAQRAAAEEVRQRRASEQTKAADRKKWEADQALVMVLVGRPPVMDIAKPMKASSTVKATGRALGPKSQDVYDPGKHGGPVPVEVVARLPSYLVDPIAIYQSSARSDNPNSYKFVIDAVDARGFPVVVAVDPKDVNTVRSMWGQDPKAFDVWEREGLLRYFDDRLWAAISDPVGSQPQAATQPAAGTPRKSLIPGAERTRKIVQRDLTGVKRRSDVQMRVAGVRITGNTEDGFILSKGEKEVDLFETEAEARQHAVNNFTPQRRVVGDSGRQYTSEQRAMFDNVGRAQDIPAAWDRLKAWISQRWVQGVFDVFRPIRDLSEYAYTLARLSKGTSGAIEALMRHGKLSLRDGAYDADTSGGLIDTVFMPLGKEATDFLYWIAGNRAERLMKEDRERLFTPQDIAAAKSLANGTLDFDYTLSNGQVTRNREAAYKDSLEKFNGFHKNVLDIAEQSGLIDRDSRQFWEHEFYVPFYRVMDDDGGVRGGSLKKGLVRQRAFEKLKGGTEQLNDLMGNTLMNLAHLVDASAKNRAAKEVIQTADALGVAEAAQPGDKKTVWYMDGGKKMEYVVKDDALMTAIEGLEFAGMRGPIWTFLTKPKHWLTVGVTASPFFKVRNLIRDSITSVAVSGLSVNIPGNLAKGFQLTSKQRQEYVSALAGGGLIRFGTMLEGNEAERTRQLIKKGAKDAHILDNESKMRAFYDKVLEPALMAYNELGNRGEEVNRMSLYDQMVKQGVDHATASLMARDLMDFSLMGSFASIRTLAQVVPFFNARMQGMYKLGRASRENTAKMAAVTGAVTLASLALLAAYGDDEDWKKREEWDRDNYWWFKFGGIAYRIPKPFEIGAIGTLAERMAEKAFSDEMTWKRFKDVTLALFGNQLAMNPVPQAVKPILDLYANKDSFTGRPIETTAMEKLTPEMRYTSKTSMPARGVSAAVGGTLSPVQVDHLLRGYFAWLGAFVIGGPDILARKLANEPTQPALDAFKFASGGMVASLDSAGSRYVTQVYEQAKELEQAFGAYRQLLKEGRTEDAREFRADNAEKLSHYREVEAVKGRLQAYSKRIREIERSETMTAAEKRLAIDEIRKRESEVARGLSR